MASFGTVGARFEPCPRPLPPLGRRVFFKSLMEVVISVAAGCVSSARLTGWLALAATANVIHLFSASDGAMSDGFFHRNTEKQPVNRDGSPKQAAGGLSEGGPSVHRAAEA